MAILNSNYGLYKQKMIDAVKNASQRSKSISRNAGKGVPALPSFVSGSLFMKESNIYIGLNDSETRQQKYDTEQYMTTLKEVCKGYHVAFSVSREEGGYFHDDGEYTEETTLVLSLIDVDKEIVRKIAEDLCRLFHQETVLVTESHIDANYIRENTEKE